MHTDNLTWMVITIIVVTLIVAMCFMLIIFYSIKLFKRKSQHELEVAQLKFLNHTLMLKSELEVQEQTFEQIAREIHDNWGQRLTLIKFQLQSVESQKFNPSLVLVDNLLEELRGFSRNLSSTRIKRIGLINAIEEDIEFLRSITDIQFNFNVDQSLLNIDEQTGVLFYRIFQEAESNILRHSKAKKVNITLADDAPAILFEILDDGIGFDPRNLSSPGIGLNNILRRCKLLNGNYQLISSPGNGTCIRIRTQKLIL